MARCDHFALWQCHVSSNEIPAAYEISIRMGSRLKRTSFSDAARTVINISRLHRLRVSSVEAKLTRPSTQPLPGSQTTPSSSVRKYTTGRKATDSVNAK